MKGDSTGYTCSAVPGTREVQVLTYVGGEKMEVVDRGPEWGNGSRRRDSSPYLKYMLRPGPPCFSRPHPMAFRGWEPEGRGEESRLDPVQRGPDQCHALPRAEPRRLT